MITNQTKISFAFFGSSRFSVIVLDELFSGGFIPACIITTPDKPQGRKLTITPNVVKQWAHDKSIKVYDPIKLDGDFSRSLNAEGCDVFIVASYGRLIPRSVFNIPAHKTLNIHPSLLPKYRGASPLQSAMLDDAKHTGVTIIQVDEKMDHGPIIAQKQVTVDEWPTYNDFERLMAKEGTALLVSALPALLAGKITPHLQEESMATYTKKFSKEDGLISLSDDPYVNFRKVQAFHEWPQAYFMINHRDKQLRVKITAASFRDGKLVIEKVVPEGGREMVFKAFEIGYGKLRIKNEV